MKKVVKFIDFQVKRIERALFVKIINGISVPIANILLKVTSRIRPAIFENILKRLDPDYLSDLEIPGVKKFSLLQSVALKKLQYQVLKKANWDVIKLPCVWGISNGGSLSLWSRETVVYNFNNAEVQPNSDFIRIGCNAYWDKYERFQMVKTIVFDQDLIQCDSTSNSVFLREAKKIIYVKVGFSLCGVHESSWGHFIGNFLPKIASLQGIENEPDLVVILPDFIDNHIKEFAATCIQRFGEYRIMYVARNVSVKCEKLYYCSGPSFISDQTLYIHPSDIHLATWSVKAMYYFAQLVISNKAGKSSKLKIYIGRRGIRNLTNFDEVEDFFLSKGYDIVFPHELTFLKKVELFSCATHVCGPYSSGFANIIFCKPGTKVLAFCNYCRILDSFISNIGAGDFNLDVTMLTGNEPISSDIHNSFSIPLSKISGAADSLGF